MSEEETNLGTMYDGLFVHRTDKNHRFMVPSEWRTEGHATEFMGVLFPLDEPTCIQVMPPPVWKKYMAKISEESFLDEEKMENMRVVGRQTKRLTRDGAGRMRLPEEFVRELNLEGEVELTGMFDRFSISRPIRDQNVLREDRRRVAERFRSNRKEERR